MTDRSAALFRAANLQIMDYPFDAALQSALSVCDEAVVVVGQSQDDTLPWVRELAGRYPGRVRVHSTNFYYDRGWQERWWDLASSLTDAEWLMYHDADEVIHEHDADLIRPVMADSGTALVSFPMVHFYMTPRYVHTRFYQRAPRLGRRSAGWRMRNWCTDETPNHPACQMVWGDEGRPAAGYRGPEMVRLRMPIYHYGWVRDPVALRISRMKHTDWYRDGQRFGLLQGQVPEPEPFDFEAKFPSLLESGYVVPCRMTRRHPAAVHEWLSAHERGWADLEEAMCTVLA